MKRIIKNSATSAKGTDPQNEYEYRKNIYLKRKHEFETLGEDDNNDVLSREEKMNIAKAEMDKAALKSVKSNKDATFKTDSRLSSTSERYKGYLIVLDRGGYGYNVYDRHRELEDAGYPSKEAAKNFIDELVGNDAIYSAEEYDASDWTELASKSVLDSDGFYTDYTLYTDGSIYICMFGDKEIYEPDENYADYETEIEQEAWDWFNSYTGFADDEDEYDVYSSEDIKASMGRYDDYFGQTAAAAYGDLISDNLKGKTVSKRKDTANEPGGLIYEANELDIDMWDLLEALEGMCRQGRAREIDDSTYEILGASNASSNSRLDQKVNASQSYLDRIEELMEQGLDEETASREAYAEFYPDEYDADDYDDSIYSSDSSKAFTGYVRTLCDNCGHLNRVKVIFPEFNKPFEDTNYKCESCGAINELTDPHVYDEDGYIISSTTSSKLDKLKSKLLKAVHDVMTSDKFGFLEDDVNEYSAVEILPVNDNEICIEVRAELDYDGLWMLKEVCDPIIQKYYPDAYLDMMTAGVMQAYVYEDASITSASNDTYYMQLKRAYKNMRKFDDMDSQSADILDLEDELNSHDTPYERYEHKTDNGCTIFYDDYIKGQEFKNSDLTERETLYYKGKKFVIHYTVKDTYDAKEAFDSFKASISMIAPYDDADYYWARIYNGMIKYIYKGKVMRVNYYFDPEDMSDDDPNYDWNVEDWYSGICDEVVQALYEANKRIESKMVHN